MIDSEKSKLAAVSFFAGVILAVILFPKKEIETVYKTETRVKIDTIYSRSIDTVFIDQTKIKTQVVRDTVLVNYRPKISLFNASFPSTYGNTKVSGEVLGEVLKMTAVNDYSIPVVTKNVTVDKTETVVVKPKGIYLGGSINSLLQPGVKLSYLDNKYLFSYQIEPFEKRHSLSISKKLF